MKPSLARHKSYTCQMMTSLIMSLEADHVYSAWNSRRHVMCKYQWHVRHVRQVLRRILEGAEATTPRMILVARCDACNGGRQPDFRVLVVGCQGTYHCGQFFPKRPTTCKLERLKVHFIRFLILC